MHKKKTLIVIEMLSIMWKYDLSDRRKIDFFPNYVSDVITVLIQHMGTKKLDRKYIRRLYTVFILLFFGCICLQNLETTPPHTTAEQPTDSHFTKTYINLKKHAERG